MYEWNARDYEENSAAQLKWARELIGKLRLRGGESVLDLGCGDGKITAEIARKVPDGAVVGVDSSGSMIARAKQRYGDSPFTNLRFTEMDAASLSFDEEFDLVFSNAALHWIKDHGSVLKGVYKSLKPGGRILFQMGGKGNANGFRSVLDETLARSEWRTYFRGFSPPYRFPGTGEYTTLLEGVGFGIKRVELIPKDMVQNGKRGLAGWIRTTWMPFTERVPEAKRERLVEAISSKYLHRYPVDRKGRVHVPMIRLEVEAKKTLDKGFWT